MEPVRDAAPEQPPVEDPPQRCSIGDTQSMKGLLDDHVLHYLESKYGGQSSSLLLLLPPPLVCLTPSSTGFQIDMRYANMRLTLGALAGAPCRCLDFWR